MPTIAKLVVGLTLKNSQYTKGLAASVKAAKDAEKRISASTKAAASSGGKHLSGFSQAYQKLSSNIKNSQLASTIKAGLSSAFSKFPQGQVLASKFAAGLGKMASVGKSAFGILAKGAAALGVSVAAGLGAAAAGIGLVVAGAWKLAQAGAPMQGIKAAFEGLAASAKGGSQGMLKALQDSSNGMISNIELMRQFNQASQLVSSDFAQKLPQAMEALGKVSASTGQDLNYLLNSLTVGVGRLSAPILDNLAIQVDLNAAYQTFADKNGLVASSLTKTQQQAALMDQVIEKLNENTKNIPPIFGSASQVFAAFKTDLQNVKDQVSMDLLPTFTQMFVDFRKFTPMLKSFGAGFSGTFAGIANVGRSVIKGLARGMGIDLEALAGNSEQWGANIVTQLAQGMAKALGAVISVLNTIGQAIASWLAPGSPPKLLPDLPKWGQNISNWLFKGMTQGNISILRDLSSQVESFISSQMAGSSSQDIAKAVLAARSSLEGALSGGSNIMSSLPKQMRGYAAALLESQRASEQLVAAQKQLNDITAKYDAQLAPISARLKEIQAERDAFAQAQRTEQLQSILADEAAPEEAKRFAALELEEMALLGQQAALESAKDTAVSAAEEKVSAAEAEQAAAEERLRLEEQLLQHQIETNNLLAQTVESLSNVAGAGGAAAGGIGDALQNMQAMGGVAPALSSSMSELAERIMGEFDGVSLAAEELGTTWGGVFDNIMSLGDTWKDRLTALARRVGVDVFKWLLDGLTNLRKTWGENFNQVKRIFGLLYERAKERVIAIKNTMKENIENYIKDLKDKINTSFYEIGRYFVNLKSKVREQLAVVRGQLAEAMQFVQELWNKIQGFWEWLRDKVFDIIINWDAVPEWLIPGSPVPIHTALEDFARFLNGQTFDFNMQPVGDMAPARGLLDPALAAASTGGDRELITIGGNTINNGMDLREFEARVRRIIREENGRR